MLLLLATAARAQTPRPAAPPSASSPRADARLTTRLAAIETGFFRAWQQNNPGYFREHLAPEAIFFGVFGVADKADQVDEIVQSARQCKVRGFRLTDLHAIQWAPGVALLTYRAEQHADCGGPVPVAMNGSSVYRWRQGQWQVVYRSEVPARDWKAGGGM